jgi:signal recognition particle receptor subunit beta
MLLFESKFSPLKKGEEAEERTVRFRTVGDLTLTGCVKSTASTVDEIIEEIAVARVTSATRRAVTTGSQRQPWSSARRKATSDDRDPGDPSDGPVEVRDGRLRRRRQVHADRPAAARLEGDFRGLSRLGPPHRRPRSEREQGITIDVAYRYFATPKRRFIIADAPGHVQYTRNMVTSASTADLGLVLVDARQGLTEQSHRHAVILSLLRDLVLAVNKMDLVDHDQATFDRIHQEFNSFASKLNIANLEVIPISALKGDNVVNRSENMSWYDGQSLMHHLENVHVASDRDLVDTRFSVEYVVRSKSDEFHDYRG